MNIQVENGPEIFNEVGRAWLEAQDLRDQTSGVQVPWNTNGKRLLENDEIIMAQHAKCMILAGYEPSEMPSNNTSGTEYSQRKKFRKIFKEVEKQTGEDEEPDEVVVNAFRANQGGC